MNETFKALLKIIPIGFATIVGLFAVLVWSPADADENRARPLSFIRDAEIENTIRAYAAPLFRAADLEPSNVRIFLVNDRSLNAFVTGGQNLFINTGLLMKSRHAGQVIGVIAHETGHIAAAHVARTQGEIDRLGNSVFTIPFLIFYLRSQEAAADQAAARLLDSTGQSALGMAEFLGVIENQELPLPEYLDRYIRTHPMARERISFLRLHLSESPYTYKPISRQFEAMHGRMRAKLHGFLNPPSRTLEQYRGTNNSLESRLARAIAYCRNSDLVNGLPLIDGLIAEFPEDPYFQELKGQMLFENGRVAEAITPYEAAVRLLPDAPLLRVGLAAAQIETNDPVENSRAIEHLNIAVRADPGNPRAWYRLSVALGRNGQFGLSVVASAERASLLGRRADARHLAARALKQLPVGSLGARRAEDILFRYKEE
jgi:predicted Zn-dependent protease